MENNYGESSLNLISELDILVDKMESLSKYTCPKCHTRHLLDDCKVEKHLVDSQDNGVSLRGRVIVRHYKNSYIYIRFCPSCYQRYHKKIKIIIF